MTSVSTRVDLLEQGAADFLLKPFVPAELLARIRLRITDDTAADFYSRLNGFVPVSYGSPR